ncbi:nuclear transport factor 2 family protein [Jatrophihabitans lederbergiae]|uniref:Nuclear transport factor 2 family protein n=1 Tax=Jatrophihabitans lederbergiae TaxID=3075547 RepID=A0ABU2JH77_9ACTN|nr:nuclear transport factor 2 family protein [Jatrophihabitans sp. DSM 44399]MDT0264345.1 nuclear transport factor 2 family protein [Jatrophihabitans sp. DSM 44399]
MSITTDPSVTPEVEGGSQTSAVAAVLRYYALVDEGDVPGLVALFAPDATYHRPGYQPIVGSAEMTAFYRDQRVIREGTHSISTVLANSPHIAVQGNFTGVLRDGRSVELRFSDFFTVGADGRFTRRDTYFFAPLV